MQFNIFVNEFDQESFTKISQSHHMNDNFINLQGHIPVKRQSMFIMISRRSTTLKQIFNREKENYTLYTFIA